MSVEYVVLANSDKGHRVSGYAHSVVPAGNNAVGTSWSQALVESLESTVSQVPGSVLPAGRQTDLDSGAKYEWAYTVDVDAHAAPTAKETALQTFLLSEEPAVIARLQNRLEFWGRTGVAN